MLTIPGKRKLAYHSLIFLFSGDISKYDGNAAQLLTPAIAIQQKCSLIRNIALIGHSHAGKTSLAE